MTMVLLIVLIAVPLLEIAVMIKVGQAIGFWPTFGIVIGTFMLGASILARSGLTMAFRVQEAMVKGEPPAAAILDGALLAFAGVLLATPGLIADVVGLALLVPPLRALSARWLVQLMFADADIHVSTASYEAHHRSAGNGQPGSAPRTDGEGPVIEGEFERIDERPLRQGRDRKPPPA